MKRTLPFLFIASIFLATGCANKSSTQVIEVPEVATPSLTNDVHWFRNSAEHHAIYIQNYGLATEKLEDMSATLKRGTWAVSMDADETVLDNSQYQKELILSGNSYSDETWDLWCERREADTFPGCKSFMKRVHELGGTIIIVSNRYVQNQQNTEDNLTALGLPYDLVMLRQDKADKQKERRWNEVTSGTTPAGWEPLEIVMYLGDNIEDFPELNQDVRHQGEEAFNGIGSKYIMFPNPMYGSWPWNDKD